jgi:hypothetical protein
MTNFFLSPIFSFLVKSDIYILSVSLAIEILVLIPLDIKHHL